MTSVPPPGYEGRAEGSWSWTPPDREAPEPSLEPLSLRLLQVAGALSALLILLVVFAWLHGGGGDPLNPVAQAAERTQLSPGSRSAIEAIYSSPASSKRLLMTGSGVYNAQTGRSRVSMTMQLPPPSGAVAMEAVGDGHSVYMRSRLFADSLPPNREWMGIEPWLGQTAETAFAPNGDAKGQLEMLQAVDGDVENIGEEEVRGVSTTRYSGTIDLARYASTLREEGDEDGARQYEQLAKLMPTPTAVEAWVDAGGLVRRMRMVMTPPTSEGEPPISMDMRIDFFDFGITPAISVPDPAKVFDATPLARAQLNLLTAETTPRIVQPKGDRPLPETVFHERASRICTQLFRQIHDLQRRTKPQLRAFKGFEGVSGDAGATREAFLAVSRDFAYAFIEPAIQIVDVRLRQLGQLSPPPHLATDYRQFLRLSALGTELSRAEARAMEVGEFEIAGKLWKRTRSLSDRSDRSAERVGLDACVESDKQGSAA